MDVDEDLGSAADAALIDQAMMVVAVDSRESAGTARVWQPGQSRASSCQLPAAYTESAEHLIGIPGDARTLELIGG